MAVEVFANQPTTSVLSGGTTAPSSGTVEIWTVASSSEFPAASSTATPPTQFHVADLNAISEIIAVTNVSGNTWTVTRGTEGTTPVVHITGFLVYQVVTAGALAGFQAAYESAPDWVNVVTQFGADPTGVNDSTTAIQNAVSAIPATGGTVYFPAGTYKVTSTITVSVAGVYLLGPGILAAVINYYGSGDCIRMYSSVGYGNGTGRAVGGGISGLTIDGVNAASGACGAHIGDIYQLKFDFGVRAFNAGTTSKGIWFDNQYFWCEDMYGHLFVEQNSTNLIFDNSANLTGQSTGSFARTNLTVVLDAKGFGDGLVLQNGAQYYGGILNFLGNMDYSHTATQHWALTIIAPPGFSYTATNASPCVFTAPGMYYGNGTNVYLTGSPTGFTDGQAYWVVNTNINAGTFQLAATSGGSPINSTSTGSGTVNTFLASTLQSSVVNINVECNGISGGPQPGTINFTSSGAATGYNNISQCTGVISFAASSVGFAHAINSYNNFFFDGPVYGDLYLWRSMGLGNQLYFNGFLTSGQTIFAAGVSTSVVDTTTAITGMQLQGGAAGDSQLLTVLNAGTGSIQFANNSHVVSGTNCIIPPNSSMTFQWFPSAFSWYPALGKQSTPDWLNVITFGADPTGVNDSTAAIQAALNAVPATGGTVYLPAGRYKVTSTLTATTMPTHITGDGTQATLISFTGTGDCLRMYTPSNASVAQWGGGVRDLAIDGTSAGNGSTGLHIGDNAQYALDLMVQNFSGTGSIGVHLDNANWFTEELRGTIFARNCASHVVFDVTSLGTTIASGSNGGVIANVASWSSPSAGVLAVASTAGYPSSGTISIADSSFVTPAIVTYTGISGNTFTGCAYVSGGVAGGTAATGDTISNPSQTSTNSFGYLDLTCYVFVQTGQDGVVVQNGALPYHGALKIKGDFKGSNSAPVSNAVLRLTGALPGSTTGSGIYGCQLDIQVETETWTFQPFTIVWNSIANFIQACYGVMDFTQGSGIFHPSPTQQVNSGDLLTYDGFIIGDGHLNQADTFPVPVTIGAQVLAQSFISAANGNVFPNWGDFFAVTLSASITINLNPTVNGVAQGIVPAPQRKTIIITQAASGGPYTVTWPHTGSPTTTNCTVNWTGGTPPTMSTGASAVDVYYLDTYDGATWYGRANQNVS